MSVKFKVVPKVNPQNRDEVKYYTQLVQKGIISRARLEDAIVRETSLSRSDVRALLIIFSEKIFDYLSQGYKVRLEDVGLLGLKIKSKGEVNEKDVSAKSITNISVGFRAATELHEKLDKTKFEKVKNDKD